MATYKTDVYNYKENLKAFFESKNVLTRVKEMMLHNLQGRTNVDDFLELKTLSFEDLLTVYIPNSSVEYSGFINNLCTWAQQPESVKNPNFWSNLHDEWQRALYTKTNLVKSYKSIW